MKVARAVALAAAAWMFASLAWVIAHRVAFPFDLEWLEGATLWHAQRILDGQPLYPPPSIDFVPHPYPPLYPALLALFGRLFGGVSYALGRGVSTASFAGALVVGWRWVRTEGGSRAAATAAMAIPCGAYVAVGAWYDLVRVDSLWLFLTAWGATLAWRARRSTAGTIAAALLLIAAFFTKQTAAPFMIAVGLGLLVAERRAALVYGATLALVGLPALWIAARVTDGWFWFYVYRVHHSHAFVTPLAVRVPGRIATLLLPGVPLLMWALARVRDGGWWWTLWLAATGIAVAAVGKGTAGAYLNALIPGIYFAALVAGVATARLGAGARGGVAWALMAATVLCAPRVVPRLLQALAPRTYIDPQTPGYVLAPLLPSAEARALDEALVARVRAVDGAVWMPTRAWYARLAGKRPLAGEMGATDVAPTGVRVAGLDDALRARRFAAVVVDEPHDEVLEPVFKRSTVMHVDGARDLVGIRRPTWWLTPR